jgi:hypothetical protein
MGHEASGARPAAERQSVIPHMGHHFSYPPGLVEEMRRERRRRWTFEAGLVLLFTAAGLVVDQGGWVAPSVILFVALILSFFEWLFDRFARATAQVAGDMLEVQGTILRQLDRDRRVIGEVDLSVRFEVTHPYYVAGSAFYTVRSRAGQVQFSSRIGGGETLMRDVLRQDDWPPGANAT